MKALKCFFAAALVLALCLGLLPGAFAESGEKIPYGELEWDELMDRLLTDYRIKPEFVAHPRDIVSLFIRLGSQLVVDMNRYQRKIVRICDLRQRMEQAKRIRSSGDPYYDIGTLEDQAAVYYGIDYLVPSHLS